MNIVLMIARILIGSMVTGALVSLAAALISNKKASLLHCLASGAVHVAVICINYFVLGRESPYTVLPSSLSVFLIVWLNYRHFSWGFVRDGFILLALYILSDMVCGMILMATFSAEQITAMRYFDMPLSYIPDFLAGTVICLLALAFSAVRSMIVRHRLGFYLLRVARPAFLLATIVILYARNMKRIAALDEMSRGSVLVPEYAIMGVLLLLGASYIVQDIRYAQQQKRNQTLEQQQETQDILLKETRMFRHNVANMLYGLQGTIMTRDYDSIWNYYQKIAEKCAVINNENIIALRRIPSMAVHALMVQKLQAANEKNIPFYVYTDEALQWRNARDSVICQILGVLIDNAMEAAEQADVRYVSLEAHNLQKGIEIVVRNTWQQQNTDFLYQQQCTSTKPGHEGIGLSSVRGLVHKDRRMIFNIYPSGRYIEANLQILW